MMHEGYKTSWVMKIVSAFIAPVLFVTFPGFVAMAAKPPEEPLLRLERGPRHDSPSPRGPAGDER